MNRRSQFTRIDDLLPGAHTVTAQYDGFQAVTVSPIFVEP